MGECVNDVVPDMGHGDLVRIAFLPAGWAKAIICCEQGCTVQAVSWMHVTPSKIVKFGELISSWKLDVEIWKLDVSGPMFELRNLIFELPLFFVLSCHFSRTCTEFEC